MKRLEEYPKPLQKILYAIFEEHLERVDLIYHSSKIENDNITKEIVENCLKTAYVNKLKKAITDYETKGL